MNLDPGALLGNKRRKMRIKVGKFLAFFIFCSHYKYRENIPYYWYLILSTSSFFFFLLEGKEKKRSKARRGWILSGSKATTDSYFLTTRAQTGRLTTDRTKKLTDRQTGRQACRLTTGKIDKESD